MHGVSHCLYMFTRNKRFLAGSVLKLMNAQVMNVGSISEIRLQKLRQFFSFFYIIVSRSDHVTIVMDDSK